MSPFLKFISYFKKETLTVLFFIVILTSWVVHLSNRNEHFQECDSSGTYNILYEFPASTLRTTALLYPAGSFLSVEQANKILDNETVHSIIQKHLPSFSREFILNQLTESSALAIFRYGLIQATALAHFPFAIQSFFSMGLGSTYSSGVGFIYGLINGKDATYTEFMSNTMAVSITVFHLAILLLFLINRRLKVRTFINVAISLVALFSISIYSSGIHIGSTVWNFTTELFWIWFLLKNINHPKILSRISWASGILVFFNYLILFFWIALMVIFLFENLRQEKKVLGNITLLKSLKTVWKLILRQKAAIILIGICGTLFFLPGQGFRGDLVISEIPRSIYYVVLNYFSWYTHSSMVNALQFAVGIIFISFGVYFLLKKDSEDYDQETFITKRILINTVIIYILLVLIKTLSFAPTRHMLFLFPIIFIPAALGFEQVIKKINFGVPKYLQLFLMFGIVLLGFTAVHERMLDTYDRTKQINIDSDVEMIGIYDCSFNLYYKYKNQKAEVNFINPKTFKAGGTYLYLSQVGPIEDAYKEWSTKFDLKIDILSQNISITDAFFIANNPNFKNSRYSRPNNLFETKFKVVSIKEIK